MLYINPNLAIQAGQQLGHHPLEGGRRVKIPLGGGKQTFGYGDGEHLRGFGRQQHLPISLQHVKLPKHVAPRKSTIFASWFDMTPGTFSICLITARQSPTKRNPPYSRGFLESSKTYDAKLTVASLFSSPLQPVLQSVILQTRAPHKFPPACVAFSRCLSQASLL